KNIDGIREIHNLKPQWGNEQKAELEFVQKIGGLDATDENYILFRPSDVALDNEGNIYVLDTGNHRVQKYDSNGIYLSTFGKKGKGPGEFESPSSLSIDAENNILVNDRGVVKFFDQSGYVFKTIKLDPPAASSRLMTSGNFITGRTGLFPSFTLKPLLNIFDQDGKHIAEFGEPVEHNNGTANNNENNIIYTFDNNDNIFFSFGTKNRIEKFTREGKLVYKMTRQLKFVPAPGKYRKRIIREDLPPAYSVEQWPEVVTRGIGIDKKERMWLITKTDPESREFEIYDPEGILLSYVPWVGLNNISKMRIINNRMFLIDRSNDMAVYEYKIVDK
ncbi:NHL repeat-containing protein, partial [candidate division KSB1 bacterium]|nr:NHL repeat-containing protein [candidate division KSB1 bacterium]